MESNKQVVVQDVFLEPGYVNMPARPTRLSAVVASGVVVTLYDRKRKLGGMNHYLYPYRGPGGPSTARYACPAVVALVRMFLDSGSSVKDIEVNMFGGAENPEAEGYVHGLSQDNVKVGMELLEKLRLRRVHRDTGGAKGRKIVFNTGTGETMVAKVNRIRSTDWYPVHK